MLAFAVGLPWVFGVAVAYVVSDYALRVPFTWYVIGRSGHVALFGHLENCVPAIVGLLAAAIALMLVELRVGSPSLIEFFGLASTSYIVSWAVLALFPSKRLLFIEAFNVGRRRLASLAQRVKPC